MVWLWILLALAALFLLFCMLPLGVQIQFGIPVFAWLKIGPVKIQVAPSKPGKKKEVPEKEKQQKTEKITEHLKKLPKPSLQDLKSAYSALWPPFRKALGRVKRGILIDPMQLCIIFAGKANPARAAELYGEANGVVWAVMPALEKLIRIPRPGIHLGVDFDAEKTHVEGSVGISMRIGTLIFIGMSLGIPALKWLLQVQKEKKREKEQELHKQKPAESQAA